MEEEKVVERLRLLNGVQTLDELALTIREVNRSNGWNVVVNADLSDRYKIPAILALIHSEVSEALEAFRNNDDENLFEELGDILIRVLDLAGGLGFNIQETVTEKIRKNYVRGYRHGGKKL